MLPRLWDPDGVRASPNVHRDQSRALAPSRYPYGPCTGYLVDLPNLQRWQDLRTSHVKLDIVIHRNITGLTIAMKKITGLINIIIPVLTRPILTNHERCSPYDRQSSRMSFTTTATSYFRVTPQYIQVTRNTTMATSNPSDNVMLMGSTIRMT